MTSTRDALIIAVVLILGMIASYAHAGPFCTSTRVGDTTYTYCN